MGGLDPERKSKAVRLSAAPLPQAALSLGSISLAQWAPLAWRRVVAPGKRLQVCCVSRYRMGCLRVGTESERGGEAVTAGGQIDRELHQDRRQEGRPRETAKR